MKKYLLLAGALFLTASLLHAIEQIGIAVMPIDAGSPSLKQAAEEAGTLLNVNLSQHEGILLVDREELARILSEQALGMTGAVNASNAAQIGQLLGAKILITGRLFVSGKNNYLVIKIIGTETGRLYAEKATFTTEEGLDKPAGELAEKVAQLLHDKSDELIVRKKETGDIIGKYKQQAALKKLPICVISVPESHMRHSIPDPAVETEIGLVLTQLGFTIINSKDHNKEDPDGLRVSGRIKAGYRIEGEAFSEYATHLGTFISCRARLEIKVVEVSTGKIVFSDRETAMALDLGESIAAKSALQNCAIHLCDRLVPTLLQLTP